MFYKKLLLFILMWISFASFIFPQLNLSITTDKNSYSYGETIHINCTVENTADTTVTITSGSYNSCQAEFSFNDYNSQDWEKCLPLVEQLIFPPAGKKIYTWTIDPKKFGLPDKDGKQTLIGYFLGGLTDTIYINAPLYNGGQLNVGYDTSNINLVAGLKDTLNVSVIDSSRYDAIHSINETWQFNGKPIDSLLTELKKDTSLNFIEYNRSIQYDSIYVTGINKLIAKPDKFFISNAYPNPFNPSTTIRYEIPKETYVTIKIFDVLGREVATLLNTEQKAGEYEVEWNAKNFASGVYFYQVKAGDFMAAKKMLLIK